MVLGVDRVFRVDRGQAGKLFLRLVSPMYACRIEGKLLAVFFPLPAPFAG